MTDKEKLEAIRTEIHRLVDVRGYDREIANDLFAFMDSLPNEPVSEDLEEAASRYAKEEYNHKSPATLPDRCIGCYAPLMYAFKAGAEWKEKRLLPMIDKICGMCQKQQDFINSKDLGELISTLSRRYPEVSFAKLSRIAVRVTKWQKEQTISKACKWIDKNAAKYLVYRFVNSMRITGIDTSITDDFRKDMED